MNWAISMEDEANGWVNGTPKEKMALWDEVIALNRGLLASNANFEAL